MSLRLRDAACGADCFGILFPAAFDGDRVSREFGNDSEPPQSEARLGVVRLGAYTAEVLGDVPQWVCRRPLELRRTGEEIIDATWRPPLELHGLVLGEDGAPAADVPVRVRPTLAGANRSPDAWRCEREDAAPDLFTAEDGSFSLPIDSAAGGFIEAGSSWDPDGFASLELTQPAPDSITLRLKRAR